jgi:hypothetical protein
MKSKNDINLDESENNHSDLIFKRAIKTFCQYQSFFLESCCKLPDDLVNDFLFAIENGTKEKKIICMRIIGTYAFKRQIETISSSQGIKYLREASKLGDEESKRLLSKWEPLESDKNAFTHN